VGRPLAAARVPPDAVTAAGLAVAALALWPAAAGGRWVLAAVAVVVVSALLDGVDGTVAILTGRVTRWGHVLDSACDRVSDVCFLAALWLAGAPGPLCAAAGTVVFLHEYLRARAAAAGMPEVGVVTVGERPTRVIVTAMFLLGAGLFPGAADGWATAGAGATLAVGAVGLAQLGVVVRDRLSHNVT
jgi:phosphatidylglycerophosphate synthase